MRPSTKIVLHALLERCPPEEKASLTGYLSSGDKLVFEHLPKTYGNPLAPGDFSEEILHEVHPSWISPYLRKFSEKEIGFFLSSLGQARAVLLGKELLYSGSFPPLTPLGKTFLQQTLVDYLRGDMDDLLPKSFLPDSPLNVVLGLKSEILSQSLDYLGLHDLTVEVRQIIEKSKLNKINEALAPSQQNYLKMLLQSREPVTFNRMGLNNWNEDPDKLKALVRQRGANRLAKALYGQDPSLIWHITHMFDAERGMLIQKLCTPLENSRASQLLIGQVLEFISYTKEHHE